MAKSVSPRPIPAPPDIPALPNAARVAYPSFDQDGMYHPGMSKVEQATVHFAGAWIQAHGKLPEPKEIYNMAVLAHGMLNHIPEIVASIAAQELSIHDVIE